MLYAPLLLRLNSGMPERYSTFYILDTRTPRLAHYAPSDTANFAPSGPSPMDSPVRKLRAPSKGHDV